MVCCMWNVCATWMVILTIASLVLSNCSKSFCRSFVGFFFFQLLRFVPFIIILAWMILMPKCKRMVSCERCRGLCKIYYHCEKALKRHDVSHMCLMEIQIYQCWHSQQIKGFPFISRFGWNAVRIFWGDKICLRFSHTHKHIRTHTVV